MVCIFSKPRNSVVSYLHLSIFMVMLADLHNYFAEAIAEKSIATLPFDTFPPSSE